MAKVAFSTLKLKFLDKEVKTFSINDKEIEVKQYLSMEDKINLISLILSSVIDDTGYLNPLKVEVFAHIYILEAYSNITFTDKQKEDILKLYDILKTNEVITSFLKNMNETEYNIILSNVNQILENYFKYTNSLAGMINKITQDYENLDEVAEKLNNEISNPNNLTLLKNVVTKLG